MAEQKELRGYAKYFVENFPTKHNIVNTTENKENSGKPETPKQSNILFNAMYSEEIIKNEYKKQKKENITKQDRYYLLIILIISIIFIIIIESSTVNKLLYLVFIIIPISSIWYYFYYRKSQKEKIKSQIYNNIPLKLK